MTTTTSRRQRARALQDRPAPWTGAEWLEWAEVRAADRLAAGEAFAIHYQASRPDRARTMVAPIGRRDAWRAEIGHRAARHSEEVRA